MDKQLLQDTDVQALMATIVKDAAEATEKTVTDKLTTQYDSRFKELEDMLVSKAMDELKTKYGWTPPVKKEFSFGDLVLKAFNHPSMVEKANDFVTNIGSRMGVLMPEYMINEMLNVETGFAEIAYPRAMKLPRGSQPDAKIKVPCRGQTATGLMDHVTFANRAELGASTQTDYDLMWTELEPTERSAYVRISNDLLDNVPVTSSILMQLFREEQIYQNDNMMINGVGVAEPLGILKADARKEITRNTTLTIKFADIVKMRASMIPQSLSRCVWIANLGCRETIESMVDLNNRYIFGSGDISKGYPETLSGLPIIFTDRVPALGTTGDLSLVDWKYYIIKDGTGPAIEQSKEVYFLNRITVMMMWWKNDGKPWLNRPILCRDNSTTISPFVVLKSNP